MSASVNHMPVDHDPSPDRWQQYLGLGTLIGGVITAIMAKLSNLRWKSWKKRKSELRQMLQEIKDEDTLKSVLRHERTHWQRGRKDESEG